MSYAPPANPGKRRTSFFGFKNKNLPPLTPVTNQSDSSPKTASPKLQKRRTRFSTPWDSSTDLAKTDSHDESKAHASQALPGNPSVSTASGGSYQGGSLQSHIHRPSLASRKSSRPSNIFGSLKSLRIGDDDEKPPLTATSTTSSTQSASTTWNEFGYLEQSIDVHRSRYVLRHGEVQISSKWLMNKKEYMVLTDTHLVRFKNQTKAFEAFPTISTTPARGSVSRHMSTHSRDSSHEAQSFGSDSSGEKDLGLPLAQIVAVQLPEESRSGNVLEIAYLEGDAAQGVFLTVALHNSDDRDYWLQTLRGAANTARLADAEPVPASFTEYAARVVEREEDYSPRAFKIYKMVKRASTRFGRVSADDSIKIAPFVCLLVIGVHKIHMIQLPKSVQRGSTPSLSDLGEGYSHGILTLTLISVSGKDDSFFLTFRAPFHSARSYQLSSLAAPEIALALKARDKALRPQWTSFPYLYNGPSPFEDEIRLDGEEPVGEYDGWSEALTAFSVAYGINSYVFRYSIEDEGEDAPRFILYPPNRSQRVNYTHLELLAVMRSLRYNESFGTLDFSRVSLDELNELYDTQGQDYLCQYQKTGAPIGVSFDDQCRATMLVSEIRALAASNRKLRRVDFSSTVMSHTSAPDDKPSSGSGIFEALYPICHKQSTNVDWFAVNNVALMERDLEYLISLLAERACHVRGLEVGSCSLTDHSFQLVLDTLKVQANTLEALVLSANSNRVIQTQLSRSLDAFTFIRKLDLSHMTINCVSEPLLGFETLKRWRLEDLNLAGTRLNDESISDLCSYLSHRQSEVLKTLLLSTCGLTASKVADIMEAMTTPGIARPLLLDVSNNPLTSTGHDRLVGAVAKNLTPTYLSMCCFDYEHEEMFSELLFAFAGNRSTRSLDLAQVSLPGEANDTTIAALTELLRDNRTLQELDISGEESRLDATRFGPGFARALSGLKRNLTLRSIKLEYQKLGVPGASALAEVIRENKTLEELYCQHNDITMSGFVNITNAVQVNKTLLYLSSLEEGRESQLHEMKNQIREARTRTDGRVMSPQKKSSGLRRSMAKVGAMDLASTYATSRKTPPVPQWTSQDEQHAYRVIAEGWEGHIRRLEGFLERNRRLARGEELFEDEGFQTRPGTSGSLSNVLEKVANDSTPRDEKHAELSMAMTDCGQSSAVVSLMHLVEDPFQTIPNKTSHGTSRAEVAASSNSSLQAPPSFLADSSRSQSYRSTNSDVPSLSDDVDRTPLFEKSDPFPTANATPRGAILRSTTETSTNTTSTSSAESPGFEMRLPVNQGKWDGRPAYDSLPPPPPKD